MSSRVCSGQTGVLYPPWDTVLTLDLNDNLDVTWCSDWRDVGLYILCTNLPNPSSNTRDWAMFQWYPNRMPSHPTRRSLLLLTCLVPSELNYHLNPFYDSDLDYCLSKDCICMISILDSDSEDYAFGGNVTLRATTGDGITYGLGDSSTGSLSAVSPSAAAATLTSTTPVNTTTTTYASTSVKAPTPSIVSTSATRSSSSLHPSSSSSNFTALSSSNQPNGAVDASSGSSVVSQGAKIGIGVAGAFTFLIAVTATIFLLRYLERKRRAKAFHADEQLPEFSTDDSALPTKIESSSLSHGSPSYTTDLGYQATPYMYFDKLAHPTLVMMARPRKPRSSQLPIISKTTEKSERKRET